VNDQLVARDSYEVGEPSSEQRFYYHQEHLGSTSVLTDSSGNVQESTEYTPYGGVLSGGTASKHQFTGQEYDHATGLNYYQSRYYNSYQRRFIQPDSIIPDAYDPQQLNPYAYVRNNPVKYVDPSGNNPILIAAALWVIADYAISANDYYQEQKIINNPNSTTDQISAAKRAQQDVLAYEFLIEPDEAIGIPLVGALDDLMRGSKTLGKWRNVAESMSENATSYQKQVTGKSASQSYVVNGVKFDGIKDGVLIDAKSGYDNFVNKDTGKFQNWFAGKESLVKQARRQQDAAEGTPIEWHFQNKNVLNATQKLFDEKGLTIQLKHTP
jgi:RHS repeat-associated protein